MFKPVNGLSAFLLVFFLAVSTFGQNTNQFKNAYLSQAQVTLAEDGKSPRAVRFSQGHQPTVDTFLQEYRQAFPLSAENQLQTAGVSNDQLGAHRRFNQYYKGIELAGAQMVLHEKAGTLWYANGHLIHGLKMNVAPAISEQTALRAALKHINAKSYMWEKPEREAFLKKEQKNNSATFYPKGELKLTSGRAALAAENMKLVYRFDIYAEKPLGRYYVDVDAKTGKIVNKIDRIHDLAFPASDVPGSGASVYNGTVAMTVDEFSPGSFRLQEHSTRAAAIETFDALNGTDYGLAVDITSTTADGPWDASGVSAHWGAEATYDYFFSAHGRNSVDDAGLTLLSYVHFDAGLVNAFWDGTRMSYGDGDGVDFGPVLSLDVVGHELTHAVTEFSSALIYQGESGALNESFSDIFGNLVEFEEEGAPGAGTGNWRIGEDLDLNPGDGVGFRNMKNPNSFHNPDTYGGTFWTDPTDLGDGDNGGVHTNSGVQNFWFYLLSTGGSGTNDNGDAYSVTGIGLADAAAIAYHNNNSFLTASSDYADARAGAIACAEALFGSGSPQALATAAAWDAVGVYGVSTCTNIALGAPATASSTNNVNVPSRAVDGDGGTFWRSKGSAGNPQYLQVDLGSGVTYSEVTINWAGTRYARSFRIRVSDDPSFTTFSTAFTTNSGTGGTETIALSGAPRSERYIRLHMITSNDITYAVNEFEVCGEVICKECASSKAAAGALASGTLPTEVGLHQNYPNPFSANGTFGNPSTQISFGLPADTHVSLKIYNMLGAEVATLVNERRPAGTHAVTFEAAHLPSGVYFSVLKAGEVKQVRKLTLMK